MESGLKEKIFFSSATDMYDIAAKILLLMGKDEGLSDRQFLQQTEPSYGLIAEISDTEPHFPQQLKLGSIPEIVRVLNSNTAFIFS